MPGFLRQSTSQAIRLGPFLDSTDGVTPETGLTIANTDINLSKNGGVFANKASGGATADGSNGWYSATLDATDTETVGILMLEVTDAGALPVWHEYYVTEEAVYDALYAASATGYNTVVPPSVAQFDARTLPSASYFDPAADTVANVTTVATTTTNTDMRGTDGAVTSLASLNDLSAAEVNAEVVDVLTVDTFAEPSSVPSSTSTILDKLSWLFTVGRNKVTQTNTLQTVRDDADTGDIATAAVSDDSTTFTRNKYS